MKKKLSLIVAVSLLGGFAFADSWKNLDGNGNIVSTWPGRGCKRNPKKACPSNAAPSYYYNSFERVHGPISALTFDPKTIYAFLRRDTLGTPHLLVASVTPTFNTHLALNQQWNRLEVEPANGPYASVFSAVVGEDWYKKSKVMISTQDSAGRELQMILTLNIVE